MKQYDKNCDGYINFKDFSRLIEDTDKVDAKEEDEDEDKTPKMEFIDDFL